MATITLSLGDERGRKGTMQITDLQLDDAAAIEQAAQALVAGFREQAPDAWPDLRESSRSKQ